MLKGVISTIYTALKTRGDGIPAKAFALKYADDVQFFTFYLVQLEILKAGSHYSNLKKKAFAVLMRLNH